jgi:hypothetical protein
MFNFEFSSFGVAQDDQLIDKEGMRCVGEWDYFG